MPSRSDYRLDQVQTVNFMQLATALPGGALKDSKYKRIQRLFRTFPLDFSTVARFIVSQLLNGQYLLTMDRTNWKCGQTNINILCLAIVHQGVAIPVLSILLDKKGNSNYGRTHSTHQVEKLMATFPIEDSSVRNLFAISLKIKFRIRIKHNTRVAPRRNGTALARTLFRNLARGEVIQLRGQRVVWGQKLSVTGTRLMSGEYLIIRSSNTSRVTAILGGYKRCWEIETLFKALKSQGFDFTATHLTELDRIEKLLALLAIAFFWAHLLGEWLHE